MTPEADVPALTTTAQNAIQQSMDDGDMNAVDTRVVKVSYVPTEPDGINKGIDTDTSSSTPAYVWVLVAGGVCIVLGIVVCTWRRRRSSSAAEDDDGSFPGSNGNGGAYMQDNDNAASVYPVSNIASPFGGHNAEMESLNQNSSSGFNNNNNDNLGDSGFFR